MAIVWTKYWGPSDDGTVLKGIDIRNIQDDINTTGLADADKIQGTPVDAPTPADDGLALTYDYGTDTFTYLAPSGLPAGLGPLPWPTATAPSGWLLCYGQAVSRVTYSSLFAAIGETFGAGDASTTFNLPDMRGRTPLGKDDMGGSSADRVTSASADSIGGASGAEDVDLSHTHTGGATGGPSATDLVDDNSGGDNYNVGSETHTHTGGVTSSSGSSAQNVMTPYQTFNYIIKT